MVTYKDWIAKAKDDFAFASVKNKESTFYDNYCYHAQQAVEKAIKGLLIYYGVEPEHTHNIGKLIIDLQKYTDIDERVYEYATLTMYAVQSRYPDDYRELSEQDFQEAVDLTKECLDWVETKIAEAERKKNQ